MCINLLINAQTMLHKLSKSKMMSSDQQLISLCLTFIQPVNAANLFICFAWSNGMVIHFGIRIYIRRGLQFSIFLKQTNARRSLSLGHLR